MYTKNLTEDLRLRLSTSDMDFLRALSEQRSVSVSECIRSIIGEYRRSLETIDVLKNALTWANDYQNNNKEDKLSNGDTKTYIDNQL